MAKMDSINHIYEKPAFQYFIILSIIATLIVSIMALANTYQLKKTIIPKTNLDKLDFSKRIVWTKQTSKDLVPEYFATFLRMELI